MAATADRVAADQAADQAAAGAAAGVAEDWRNGGFALYVHWPFCLHKCPYCDFNSHVQGGVDHDAWARALSAEVARLGAEVPGRELASVFFGGGTPSLMPPAVVGAVLDAASRAWHLPAAAEVTLEANPTSVEAGRFRAYRALGVNRLSLGVQALNEGDLRRLGRMHSVPEALQAIDIARQNFDRVSMDLIYGRQDQGEAAWEAELKQALALGLDHLSLYMLTIEAGTVFAARAAAGKLRGLPGTERAAALYTLTQALCEAEGLSGYEISNHARPGAEGRHNQVYWRYGDYAGVGPGAHGRLTLGGARYASDAVRDPSAWLAAVAGGGAERREVLSPRDQAREMVLMGLRLEEGIALDRLRALDPAALDPDGMARVKAEGLARVEAGRLGVTAKGRLVLEAVIREVLA